MKDETILYVKVSLFTINVIEDDTFMQRVVSSFHVDIIGAPPALLATQKQQGVPEVL